MDRMTISAFSVGLMMGASLGIVLGRTPALPDAQTGESTCLGVQASRSGPRGNSRVLPGDVELGHHQPPWTVLPLHST